MGTVIRRILARPCERCLIGRSLFPVILGIRHLYIWAQPISNIEDKRLREHLEQITQTYLTWNGFVIRAIFYFAVWNVLSFLLSKWSNGDRSGRRPRQQRTLQGSQRPGLILYGFTISFARHRLGDVARPQLDFNYLWFGDPDWRSASAMAFAVVVERILFNYKPMSEMLTPTSSTTTQMDARLHHGLAYFNFSQWLIIWAGNLLRKSPFICGA